MSATYGFGSENPQQGKAWDMFLNMMMEQTLSSVTRGGVQLIETNRGIVLEALMRIGPDDIREKVRVAIIENYCKDLFDNQIISVRPRPLSLEEVSLAECFFGPSTEGTS